MNRVPLASLIGFDWGSGSIMRYRQIEFWSQKGHSTSCPQGNLNVTVGVRGINLYPNWKTTQNTRLAADELVV